jgi:hypothetical protein
MPELDLVPNEYRQSLRLKRGLFQFLCAYGVLLALLSSGRLGLAIRVQQLRKEVSELQMAQQQAINQQSRLDALTARKETATQRIALLDSLYGGLSAEQVLMTLDRAVDQNIWFQHLTFQHEGQAVPHTPETVNTGYFIVIPKDRQQPQQQEAWQIKTHMEIVGQARDHTALARFIKRLTEQTEVDEARLINSDLRRYVSADVVDFKLAVVLSYRPDRH